MITQVMMKIVQYVNHLACDTIYISKILYLHTRINAMFCFVVIYTSCKKC